MGHCPLSTHCRLSAKTCYAAAMLGRCIIVALTSALLGCKPDPDVSPDHGAPAVQVDHVIVGTNNLEAGMASLERLTGVQPVVGGEHPGKGTRNALMSLGDGTYLELLAPNPREPVASDDVRALHALTALRPIGWAVGTKDIEATRTTLGSQGFSMSSPDPGSRRRPDGSLLEWQTFGFEGFEHPLAPFFIRWQKPELQPSRTSPGGCRFAALKLIDPASDKLAAALLPLRINVTVEKADEQGMELELSCPKGKVMLR